MGITSVVDQAKDPAFSTAIGLALWGYSIQSVQGGGKFGKLFGGVKQFDKVGSGIVKLFKSLKP
jgi:hypothetical protein